MSSTSAPSTPLQRPQRLRVLIVDDNADDRSEQRGLLFSGSESRFAFSEAELGAAAVAAVLNSPDGPPDCVLLDYHLPDMNAQEVLAAICDSEGAVVCPVVVLTGSSDRDLGQQMLRCGAQDHLPKAQLTAAVLVRAMNHAMERWAMARELRHSTHLLAQRERDFRALADNSPDILTRFDRQLRHVFVNQAITRTTGRPVSELIGKTNRELDMPPFLVDQWEEAVQSVFETGQPRALAFCFDGLAGRQHFSARLVPEFGADGSIEHVLGVTQDVSAQHELEHTLREVDRRKDEFIALLSHELRGPLAPIQNGLMLLHKAPADSPSAVRARLMMDRQLKHLVRLVDDLLDASRIGTGKLALQMSRIALKTVVEHAVEATQPLMTLANHQFALRMADEQPVWLDGDLTRLSQVLGNLLTNAAKYTPPGGHIELFAGVEGNRAVMRVSDNGRGIAPDMQQSVFDMFAQIDVRHGSTGLGIGLALVRQLLLLHGGDVECHSAGKDQGSSFTAWLPLPVPLPSSSPSPSPSPSEGAG